MNPLLTDRVAEQPTINAAVGTGDILDFLARPTTGDRLRGVMLAHHLGDALVFIADSGHFVMLDQPERVAELIQELLR